MRYLIYFLLLYIFLPFNHVVDILSILIFFVIFNEDNRFALIFSFFNGLLIDLYHPVSLGFNTLIYTAFGMALLYLKQFIIKDPLTTLITFTIFYLSKTIVIHIVISSPFNIQTFLITVFVFLPAVMILNRTLFKIWMRI